MSRLINIPPPVYALMLLILAQGFTHFLPLRLNVLHQRGLAWVLMAFGGGIMLWAWLHFWKKRTTPIPTKEPSALVAEGPYRYSRNPMYLGILLALSGIAFLSGSLYFLLVPVVFFFIADRLFIPYEEGKLERLFGNAYLRLKASVKRWL